MSRGPKWSPKEEKVLLTQIRKNSDNLQKAFRTTARLLERSPKACQHRWYNKFSNCPINNIEAICFTTVSDKTMTINSKNGTKKTKKYKTNNNIWKKIKDFLKDIL